MDMNLGDFVECFDHKAALRSLAAVATPERKAEIVDDLSERLPEKLDDYQDRQIADLLLRGLEVVKP